MFLKCSVFSFVFSTVLCFFVVVFSMFFCCFLVFWFFVFLEGIFCMFFLQGVRCVCVSQRFFFQLLMGVFVFSQGCVLLRFLTKVCVIFFCCSQVFFSERFVGFFSSRACCVFLLISS